MSSVVPMLGKLHSINSINGYQSTDIISYHSLSLSLLHPLLQSVSVDLLPSTPLHQEDMPRLSVASELTVTRKLSIASIQDMQIPLSPGSPNSIHRSDEYKALKVMKRSLYEYEHKKKRPS